MKKPTTLMKKPTNLQEAEEIIAELRRAVADAILTPMGMVPDSCDWITNQELQEAEKRRINGR